jgi:WD40 repeat protein
MGRARTGAETLTLHDNISTITSVAFSADGRRLVSGGFVGNVRLWDLATGREALTLRGHRGGVRSVAFSRDGNRIVSSSLDGTVRIWNATPLEGEARQEVANLIGHEGGVHSVAFSPDGRHLASAGADATVRYWDFQRGLGGGANPPIRILHSHKRNAWQISNVASARMVNSSPLVAKGVPRALGSRFGIRLLGRNSPRFPMSDRPWPSVRMAASSPQLAAALARNFPSKFGTR